MAGLSGFTLRVRSVSVVLAFCHLCGGVGVAQPPTPLYSGGIRQVAYWEYEAAQRGQVDLDQQTLGEDWALVTQFSNAFLHLRVPFSSQVIVHRQSGESTTVRSRGGFRHLQLTGLPPQESTATIEVRMHNESCLKEGELPYVSCTKQVTLWPGKRQYLTFAENELRNSVQGDAGEIVPEVIFRLPDDAEVDESDTAEPLPAPADPTSTRIDYEFELSDPEEPAELTLTFDGTGEDAEPQIEGIMKWLQSEQNLELSGWLEQWPRAVADTFRVDLQLVLKTTSGERASVLPSAQVVALSPEPATKDTQVVPFPREADVQPVIDFLEGIRPDQLSDDKPAVVSLRLFVSRLVQSPAAPESEVVLDRYRLAKPVPIFKLKIRQ